MKEKDGKSITDRRNFLKLAGLGSISSGVALVAGQSSAIAQNKDHQEGGLYQETEHVKTYYELARN